jgi:hypothetical protein
VDRPSLLIAVVVAVVALAGGCASSDPAGAGTSPADVRVYRPDQFPDREYEVLGELEETEPVGAPRTDRDPYRVSESDLQAERSRQAAEDRAIARLRSRAAKLDADALVVAECGRLYDPGDPSTRYQESVRCLGFAVRFKVLGSDGLHH